MSQVCFIQTFDLFHELFEESFRVFWRHIYEAWSGAVFIADELFDENVVFECERGWNVDVSFACQEEITVFALRPCENDLTAALEQAHEARIGFDIVEHTIKITGFKTVDFDSDEAFVGFYRAENVTFFADGNRAD